MQSLPQFKSEDRDFELMQSAWSTALNPLLRNAALQSLILPNIQLVIGPNVINHKLGRKLQGWKIVRKRGPATDIYDQQDNNASPALTLALNSNAIVNVDIEVF